MHDETPLTPETNPAVDTAQNTEDTGAYLRALADKFCAHIPEEERRMIPPDYSKNHRHYRNATRKESEASQTIK